MPIETEAGQLVDAQGNLTTKTHTVSGLMSAASAAVSGTVTASDVAVASGKLVHSLTNTIARTDTSAKALFTLPANAVIVALRVYVPVASDAATTATISVGKSGTQTAYVNALDVKGAGTGVISAGAKTTLGTVGGSVVPVTGIYAETGSASTTGGPFTVFVDYTTQ